MKNIKNIKQNDKALLFELLTGAAMAIIIFFAIMNIGTFINSTLGTQISDQVPLTADGGDNTVTGGWNNRIYNTTKNLSGDFDDVLDALSIAAIVMAITLPLAAVVAIRRFL